MHIDLCFILSLHLRSEFVGFFVISLHCCSHSQETPWKNTFWQVTTEKQMRRVWEQQQLFLVWMYMIVSGWYDRYMHQIFMTLCVMHTVYKQVLVRYLLSAVRAQHTSTCRPDPIHEYKTDEPLSLSLAAVLI